MYARTLSTRIYIDIISIYRDSLIRKKMEFLYVARIFVLLILMKSLPLSHASLQLTFNVTSPNQVDSFSFRYNATSFTNSHTRYILDASTSLRVECSSSAQSNVSLLCGDSNTNCSGSVKQLNLTEIFISNYTCIANNSNSSLTQNITVSILLGYPPAILPRSDPEVYLLENRHSVLEVEVSSLPAPDVSWSVNSMLIPINLTNISTLTNVSTLFIPFQNTFGTYTVIAINILGNVSESFEVRLGKAPLIISRDPPISPHYVLASTSFNLTVVVTAIPPPAITWERNSRQLFGSDNNTISSGDNVTYTLSIPMIDCTDSYTVSVQNQFEKINTTFTVMIGYPPEADEMMLTYVSNSSVTLYCNASAMPPVSSLNCSMWYFNNTQLCGSGFEFEGTTMTIHQVNVSHAGAYTCTPSNQFGTASTLFNLQIHTFPTFLETGGDRNLTLNSSQSLTLTCTAVGIPLPRIEWRLDGKVYSPQTPSYIHTNGGRSVLSFTSLQNANNGTYRCIARATITRSPGLTELSNASSNGTLLTIIPLPPTSPPRVPPLPPFHDTLIFTGVFVVVIGVLCIFVVSFGLVCLLRTRIRSVRIMGMNQHEREVAHILEMSMVHSEKSFVIVPKEHTMIDSLSETGIIVDIKVRDIANYIEELKANDQLGFSEQYDLIRKKSAEHPYEVGDLLENKSKNRYNNIFCYDRSRVKLTPIDDAHNDFIHANFITGYNREREYIATQGPLENTIEDFWRMVWEYHCSTIVMLTRCTENLKRKCAFYWVEEGEERFFEMAVSYVSSLHLVDYSIIKLRVRPVDFTGDELMVSLFQFVSWPDFGTPDSPAGLLHFRNKIRETHPFSSPSPVVVHCSAGVGRSGTFIALDVELQKAAAEDRINPFNRVIELREERNLLIQTEAQYVFLHSAILEGILFGYEDTPVADLPVLIDNLYKVDEEAGKTGFELDFQALILSNIDSRQFSDGNLPCNSDKNRRNQVLPYNKNRIKLTMIPGVEGSDYINASLIDSYAFKNVFIATQAPPASTICDFWRMIFERNVTTVIMLCNLVERGTEVSTQYWPELGESLDLEAVLVTNEGEELNEELRIVERDLTVEYRKLKSSLTIKHYQYTGWVDNRLPEDFSGLIELLDITHEAATENKRSPVVVHCTSGIGRTGVFLALYNSIEQVTFEESVNLFYVIKKLRLQRAQTIQSIHQYEFCYLALTECLRAIEQKDQ